jgi:Zn ribbon nucleic-acid-binding protein
MQDGGAEDSNKPDGATVLSAAFPDYECLRCGYTLTYFSVEHDAFIEAGFGDGEVLHTVCRRCGYHERHVMKVLRTSLASGDMPVGKWVTTTND